MQAKYLLLLRVVLIEILLLHVLYSPAGHWNRFWVWGLLGAYAAAAAATYWLSRRRLAGKRAAAASFLLDVVLTSLILRGAGGVRSELYIAYFLVILISCLQENLAYSFIVGGVSALVYGALAFPGSDWISQPFYLLHVAFLMATAFFSAYLATTVKRAEQEAEERFEQKVAWMQRLSSVGQALASVLHEVRTPINTVLLSAEYAQGRLERGETAEVGEQLRNISREAERAAGIVSSYLEFVKPSDLVLSPVRLDLTVGRVLESMAVWLEERNIELAADLPAPLLIDGSERHLSQVFSNVVMNGIEAMPLGGRLEVSGSSRDGEACVVISDTGVGIGKAMTDKLFKPFATSKDDYEGHGLGLSIARWIVQKHAGTISILSEGEGKGARVEVVIPLRVSADET